MIGLGQMGGHMCDHVTAAGHDVRAFDLSDAALDARVAAGARARRRRPTPRPVPT